MNSMCRAWITLGAVLTVMSLFQQFDSLLGQGGAPGQLPPANLPTSPTAVTLPTMSAEVTGPGPVFDSHSVAAARAWARRSGYAAKESLHQRHRQRPAVQDAHRRAQAVEPCALQRAGARRVDARQRRGAHVRVHVDLHDGLGACRRRDPDHEPEQSVRH